MQYSNIKRKYPFKYRYIYNYNIQYYIPQLANYNIGSYYFFELIACHIKRNHNSLHPIIFPFIWKNAEINIDYIYYNKYSICSEYLYSLGNIIGKLMMCDKCDRSIKYNILLNILKYNNSETLLNTECKLLKIFLYGFNDGNSNTYLNKSIYRYLFYLIPILNLVYVVMTSKNNFNINIIKKQYLNHEFINYITTSGLKYANHTIIKIKLFNNDFKTSPYFSIYFNKYL